MGPANAKRRLWPVCVGCASHPTVIVRRRPWVLVDVAGKFRPEAPLRAACRQTDLEI